MKGYRRAVLTPNAVEFSRLVHSVLKRGDAHPTPHPDPALVAEVATALGGVTIVHKENSFFLHPLPIDLWVTIVYHSRFGGLPFRGS